MSKQRKVIAKPNAQVVRELQQMGILSQSESPGSYPQIGQDDTWESLYQHHTVKAKKAAIAKCIAKRRPDLANVVSRMPVRRRIHTNPTPIRTVVTASLDDNTLDQLVQMAAESSEYPNPRDAEATPEVKKEAQKFEAAVEKALKAWVKKYPLAEGYDVSDLMDESRSGGQGGYKVLMTLRGEGVGIWDGDWDHFFNDSKKEIKALQRFLGKKLSSFADETGTGSLNQAFDNAAYETAGGEEYEEENARVGGISASVKKEIIATLIAHRKPKLATAVSRMAVAAPQPKFKLGDKVKDKDGSREGEVSFVGEYDDHLGGYRYKVVEKDGTRKNWNETSMIKARRRVHAAPGYTRTVGVGKFDYEGAEAGVKITHKAPNVYAHVYYPLANIGKRGKKVDVVAYQLFTQSGNRAVSSLRKTLKASKGLATQKILTAVRSAFIEAEKKSVGSKSKVNPKFFEATRRQLNGCDASIPDHAGSPVYASQRGKDVGVHFDKPNITVYSKQAARAANKENGYHYLTVPWGLAAKVDKMSASLMKLKGLDAVGEALSAAKVGFKVQRYTNPIFAKVLANRRGRAPRKVKASAEATELLLYTQNDGDIYRQRVSSIQKNLEKKWQSGKYDHSKAWKIWMYALEDGAKKYAKEFDSPENWSSIFPKGARKEAALQWAGEWQDEAELQLGPMGQQ